MSDESDERQLPAVAGTANASTESEPVAPLPPASPQTPSPEHPSRPVASEPNLPFPAYPALEVPPPGTPPASSLDAGSRFLQSPASRFLQSPHTPPFTTSVSAPAPAASTLFPVSGSADTPQFEDRHARSSGIPAPPPLLLTPTGTRLPPSPSPYQSWRVPASAPAIVLGAPAVLSSQAPTSAHSPSLRRDRTGMSSFVDNDVMQFLAAVGYQQYVELFQRKRVAGETLRTLSNRELRDDLGISNLRHRREILKAIARAYGTDQPPSLPEFGRILVHLSTVRTWHSWLRLGFHQMLFSLAIARIAPQLRPSSTALPISVFFTICGLASHLYGFWRHRAVTKIVEKEAVVMRRSYSADLIGAYGAGVLCLGMGAAVIRIILANGFD